MSEIQDSVDQLVRWHVAALGEEARDMLHMMALLPPAPNSVSRDATLWISSGHLPELEVLTTIGAAQEITPHRYAVAAIFRPALALDSLSAQKKRRLTAYYAEYAYVHSDARGSIEAEYENLRAALDIADSIGAVFDLGRILIGLSNSIEVRGGLQNWGELLKKALEFASRETAGDLAPMLLLHLARLQIRQGSPEEVRRTALRALEMAPDPSLESNLHTVLGHAALDASHYEEAESRLRYALQVAEAAKDRAAMSQALVILGTVLTRRKKYAAAEEYTTAALMAAQEAEDLPLVASLGTNLGVLQYHQGQFQEAVETYDKALAVARSVRFREKEGALLQAKGGALIDLGRPEEALPVLDEALVIFDEIQHRWYKSTTLKERGLAHLRRGDPESSVRDFEEAMAVSPAVTEIEAHCRWGLSQAFVQLKEQGAALEQAQWSVRLFEQIQDHRTEDARRWLESLAVAEPAPEQHW